jgi:hypothetical protein
MEMVFAHLSILFARPVIRTTVLVYLAIQAMYSMVEIAYLTLLQQPVKIPIASPQMIQGFVLAVIVDFTCQKVKLAKMWTLFAKIIQLLSMLVLSAMMDIHYIMGNASPLLMVLLSMETPIASNCKDQHAYYVRMAISYLKAGLVHQ